MSPVRNLSLLSPNPAQRSTHSAGQAAVQSAAPSILLSDDIMVLPTALSRFTPLRLLLASTQRCRLSLLQALLNRNAGRLS